MSQINKQRLLEWLGREIETLEKLDASTFKNELNTLASVIVEVESGRFDTRQQVPNFVLGALQLASDTVQYCMFPHGFESRLEVCNETLKALDSVLEQFKEKEEIRDDS